ncbi:pyridoxamine 5'-phosphate oxidase family protein [Comamonas antarctica]|nr:pyridoxamine 5'-phosphate oxidase family protein [Comamonas antarctica]
MNHTILSGMARKHAPSSAGARAAGASGASEPSPASPRSAQTLRALLHSRRTATLATQSQQAAEAPGIWLVPYAIDGVGKCLVLLASSAAPHARQMQAQPVVSLLIAQSESAPQPVHIHERVSIIGLAKFPVSGSAAWVSARHAYLRRFPDATTMTQLGDFRFVCIGPQHARHVVGYGATRSVEQPELLALLASPH